VLRRIFGSKEEELLHEERCYQRDQSKVNEMGDIMQRREEIRNA
jgi:hypothetical protein